MSIDVMSSDEAYTAFYETLGRSYPEGRVVYEEPLGRARRKLIHGYLRAFADRGFFLLDVGCNGGDYVLHYASLGGTAHGIDISSSLISAAATRAARENLLTATFEVANAEAFSGAHTMPSCSLKFWNT